MSTAFPAGRGIAFAPTLPVPASVLVLRPDTAERDLRVFDALHVHHATPGERLTALIAAGFEPVEEGAGGGFERLSLIDRQAALFRLALAHGSWPAWFVTSCPECRQLIDVRVRAEEFACRPAEEGFVTVELGRDGVRRRFMLPNGAHEAMLGAPGARGRLAAACALDPLDAEEAEDWAELFDAAVERDAARQPLGLPMDCPHCGGGMRFWFDPYDWITRHAGRSLAEVHAIAGRYGWSERAILDMPQPRRQAYLALIGGEA